MFTRETLREIDKIADRLGIEPAALKAVAEVESAGVTHWTVNGENLPVIRFEGHYFYKLLSGAKRNAAMKAGLASPKMGAVKNPNSGQGRYNLLDRAIAIDEPAALESCSWGLGQVMGSHWKKLGYNSVQDMVKVAKKSVAGQIEIMARYIEKFGLVDELQSLGFAAFAKQYNGPSYKKFNYDVKMKNAYNRYKRPGTDAEQDEGGVAEYQQNLKTLGYFTGIVDGKNGPKTKTAVRKFQADHGLSVDGNYGPLTDAALDEAVAKQGNTFKKKVVAVAANLGGAATGAEAVDRTSIPEKITDGIMTALGVAQPAADSTGSMILQYGVSFLSFALVAATFYGIYVMFFKQTKVD